MRARPKETHSEVFDRGFVVDFFFFFFFFFFFLF
jgi:hypothetical protein